MRLDSSPRLIHCKTALKDTPEFQEISKLLTALNVDSQQKLEQDTELHAGLEALFSQVQAIREGLAILSDAFITETGNQNKRLIQLEKQVHIIGERHDVSQRRLETRLVEDVHALDSRLNDTHEQLNERISALGGAQRSGHAALQSELREQVEGLSAACESQLQAHSAAWTQQIRSLDERVSNDVVDMRRSIAANKVEAQQQHSATLKHAHALTDEVTRLAAAHGQLDTLRLGQQGQLRLLSDRVEELRDAQADALRGISEQLKAGSQSLGHTREEVNQAVEAAVAALTKSVQEHHAGAAAQFAALKADLGSLAVKLRDGLQRVQSETAEARHATTQERDAATRAATALRAEMTEHVAAEVREVLATVTQLETRHDAAIAALEDAAATTRTSRDADLEIIERALSAAHENQEQTDKVLKDAMTRMREMELRLGNVVQQGDVAADEVEALSHRVGIIQRALVDTGKTADPSAPALSLSSSMRHGRRSPRDRASPGHASVDFDML